MLGSLLPGVPMRSLTALVFASLALALVPGVSAQDQQHEHAVESGDPGQLGEVHFPVSCTAHAQQDFNRAAAMLHSFWYEAAEQAFSVVAEKDPNCALAHWGVAMSRFRQLWEEPTPEDLAIAQDALRKARMARPRSDRERGYIDALAHVYQDAETVDYPTRKAAYEDAMEDLSRLYTDDSEATIFYALAILGSAYSSPPDRSYARQKKAGSILENILLDQPNHPGVAHYIIHSYDYPLLARRALEAARQYAKIAPDAPHALHMPSHIFTRLGLWRESIASNQAAAAASRRAQWTGEELHASDYLAYAYAQLAQDREVETILSEVPKQRERLRNDESNYPAGLYAAAAFPARFAIERREWNQAAALALPQSFFPGGRLCWAEAPLYFARGLGAARSGELDEASRSIEQLGRCQEVLARSSDLWADAVEAQRRTVAAWLALAQGRKDEALTTMRSAADLEDSTDKPPTTPGAIVPARELLGEMLLELQRPAEALPEFEAVLDRSPGRFNAFYGAARAAELVGDLDKARGFYTSLAALAENTESERPALSRAKAFLGNSRD